MTIDPETGEWLIDKKGTGWYAKATAGHSPYIADGTNGDKGYWYFGMIRLMMERAVS